MRIGFETGLAAPALRPRESIEALLGEALLTGWDVERRGTLQIEGDRVLGWTDAVRGVTAVATSPEVRPRLVPGAVRFDGAQALDLAAVPFALGGAPIEIWAHAELVVSAGGAAMLLGCGAPGTGVNLGVADNGAGAELIVFAEDAAFGPHPVSGWHVVRVRIGAALQIEIDGIAGAAAEIGVVSPVGALRIGAAGGAQPELHYTGSVGALLVTRSLAPAVAAQLGTMLGARRAI